MGYYTRYELSSPTKDNVDWEGIVADLRFAGGYPVAALNADGTQNQECKWYEHEEEMKKFSKKYPDMIFVLKGEGEESGDMWIKYFKNGKMQNAQISWTFEEYDPSKLA
jgi:hypothetical protein